MVELASSVPTVKGTHRCDWNDEMKKMTRQQGSVKQRRLAALDGRTRKQWQQQQLTAAQASSRLHLVTFDGELVG